MGESKKYIGTVIAGLGHDYLVRYGLSWAEKRTVALAILMEVSNLFEGFQSGFPWNVRTNSGFSQEDLVSNLLGFHIAIGDYTREQVPTLCKKVSKDTALAIWDREGSVEENKNRTFTPALAKEAGHECADSKKIFPEKFRKIRPAFKVRLFTDFPGPGDGLYLDYLPPWGYRGPTPFPHDAELPITTIEGIRIRNFRILKILPWVSYGIFKRRPPHTHDHGDRQERGR